MAEHKTKFDIGEKVFVIYERDGYMCFDRAVIKGVNIEKSGKTYKIGWRDNWSENSIFTKFNDAKIEAIRRQTNMNKKYLEIVNSKEERDCFRTI